MPVPVIGGVLVTIIVALLNTYGGISIQFAGELTNFFLLMFFTTLGLSAKLSTLKAGGRPLVILCVVTVILLVAQNFVGILVASASGAHPFYGLLIGSISFVGGPGTAAAWAKEAQGMGLVYAPEIAVGAATLAVVVGAMVSVPFTGWLIRHQNLQRPTDQTPASWVVPEAVIAWRMNIMMGRQASDQAQLFYSFNLEERIPASHLLRRIDVFVRQALADIHDDLAFYYSHTGRPHSPHESCQSFL